MPFMEKQIEYGTWVQADGTNGLETIPADLVDIDKLRRWINSESPWAIDKVNKILRDYVLGTILSAEVIDGYGARLSAPGYMDCTEWSVYSSESAAREALVEMYGNEDDAEGNED